MGHIQFCTTQNLLPGCRVVDGITGSIIFSSSAAKNDNDILIGYAQITITETDPSGNLNGKLVKNFNINTSSSSYGFNGAGITAGVPYCAPLWASFGLCSQSLPTFSYYNYPSSTYLNPAGLGFAPTPSSSLEGKIMQEQYFDNNSK